MKKILSKSYLCLIYIFFVLFILILRMDANEHPLIYSIGLIIGAIFIAIIPFFTNNCKKISVRRFYLSSMILISFSVVLVAISYLLVNVINQSETTILIYVWILRISQALFITSGLYMIIYTFKDMFKKDYTIEKFDIQAFQMIINIVTYIIIYYIVFDFGEPKIDHHIGGFNGLEDYFTLTFNDFSTIRNYILLISGVYILVYIILEVIKYNKFEKIDKGSDHRYN